MIFFKLCFICLIKKNVVPLSPFCEKGSFLLD